jgi:hypothetical protein
MVAPDKAGVVGSVHCSLRVHNTPGETAFCGCVETTIGKWRYPAAHGKLGALESGTFIYSYTLAPP